LRDAQSKHIPEDLTGPLADLFKALASGVGYPFARIGTHKRRSADADRDAVRRMATLAPPRPVKLVVTRNGLLWADNTHWALAALVRHGVDAQVRDIPHYFVDLRGDPPAVVRRPTSLSGEHLRLSVAYAAKIQDRLDRGWRPSEVSFTVGDLYALGRYGEGV
jgi:hypothetical protein